MFYLINYEFHMLQFIGNPFMYKEFTQRSNADEPPYRAR